MAFELGRKKKVTVIAIATMLVVAAIVGTTIHVRRAKQVEIHTEEKTGLLLIAGATVITGATILILCKYTDFREICRETLDRIKAGIKLPRDLIKGAFSHTIERIQTVIDKTGTIRINEKSPRGTIALDQCKELLDTSIDDLKRSIDKIGLHDIPKLKDNTIELRVWLSGSVTYQQTCLDGFDNTTGDSGPAMTSLLDIGIKLTRNSLAMVDGIIELAGGKPPRNIIIPRGPQPEPDPLNPGNTQVDVNIENQPRKSIFDWRINRKRIPVQPQDPPTDGKQTTVVIDGNNPQPNPKQTNVDVNIERNNPQPNPKQTNVDVNIERNKPQPNPKQTTVDVNIERNKPQPNPKQTTVDVNIERNKPQPNPKQTTVVIDRNKPQPNPKLINIDWRVDTRTVPQPPTRTRWKREVVIERTHTRTDIPSNRRMLDQMSNNDQQEADNMEMVGDNEPYPTWADTSRRSLINADPATIKASAVVAQDGSGQFKTISEAVAKAPKNSPEPFVIQIKAGVYKENVVIPRRIDNVVFLGEGPLKTRITGNKNYVDGASTFHTATVAVNGDGFMARGVGFENTAGPEKHQAVALRVSADMTIFHDCAMDAYQDTLYTHSYRQFYRQCTISGTIDFIFGNAAAVFQDCKLVVRKPMANQACMVTAQGRKDQHSVGGLVFDGCTITAEPEFMNAQPMPKSYLGRPWKEFSRTIIMQSFIDKNIAPEGWSPWVGTFGQDTCYYAEYNNKGPGADTSKRVTWKGVKKISQQEALSYTPGKYIQGDQWIRGSGVPYDAGFAKV